MQGHWGTQRASRPREGVGVYSGDWGQESVRGYTEGMGFRGRGAQGAHSHDRWSRISPLAHLSLREKFSHSLLLQDGKLRPRREACPQSHRKEHVGSNQTSGIGTPFMPLLLTPWKQKEA